MNKMVLLALLTITGAAARADDNCPRPHGPPPEAFTACAQKSAGDSCQVTIHDHTIDGTCAAAPDGTGKLACRPNQPPPGPPPDQAGP
ncbi:MAG TPA: hypothetical protein VMT03_18725 [Polyangia bacterium]|nr:hypothetical protein [Polyangia bacterium]